MNSNGPKMSFLAILETLNFEVLVNLGLESCPNLLNSKLRPSEMAKMTFLDRLNSLKCDFTKNLSGGKIIKFQQSQALTSHLESFWSIVQRKPTIWSLRGHFLDYIFIT